MIRNFFAALFSFFIPGKPLRHRVRGFIEYGPIRAMLLRWRIRRNKTNPKYNLAICAIAKNEGPYFAEWIEYHKNIGVEKFYIYDNESDDNAKDILAPYVNMGLVEYIYWPGTRQQMNVYADCLAQHRFDSRWIAFIDLDEFIVPKHNKNITDFLSEYADYAAVEINWVCHGSNGLEKYDDRPVMERFTAHGPLNHNLNRHIKSIVQPRKILKFMGAHEAIPLFGKIVDVNKKQVTEYFRDRDPVGQDIICINHYAIKSREEFLIKKNRGRAKSAGNCDWEYFKKFDLNS